MSQAPPPKYTNDSGLGHVIDSQKLLDNKIKVNSSDKAVLHFMSSLSRDQQYYKRIESRNNMPDQEFVNRYLEYYTN